jgi:hypothetical protein
VGRVCERCGAAYSGTKASRFCNAGCRSASQKALAQARRARASDQRMTWAQPIRDLTTELEQLEQRYELGGPAERLVLRPRLMLTTSRLEQLKAAALRAEVPWP